MKSKISLMGMLCLINKLIKIKQILALVLVFMCVGASSSNAIAQKPILTNLNIPEVGLKIGDKVPEEIWNLPLQVVNHPEGKETITLNDYRGKLIILDFWATWCRVCINSLEKLDKLQEDFADKLVIMPITYQETELIAPFLKNKNWSLPSVVLDTKLKNDFPHRSIPHQVWIKDGKVLAITGAEYSNTTNIDRVINGEKFIIGPEKVEVDFNPNLPLFHNMNGGDIKDILIRSIFSKRISADIGGIKREDQRLIAYNMQAANLFYECYNMIIPYPGRNNRMVWEISDSLKNELLGDGKVITGIYQDDIAFYKALKNNSFCYEFAIDTSLKISKDKFKQMMRGDLNNYFSISKGIESSLEKRIVECYVLIKLEKKSQKDIQKVFLEEKNKLIKSRLINDKSYRFFDNEPYRRLFGFLSAILAKQDYPIIESDQDLENVTLIVDSANVSIESIKNQLNMYDFDLVKQSREIEVIVIKYSNSKEI